jgi:cobalt/nickel transport system permease protein
MALLTPLGLLAPGGAFGEDVPQDLDLAGLHLSAIPEGLNKYNGFWHNAILNGYDFAGDGAPWLGYILSALIGIAVIGVAIYLVTLLVRLFTDRRRRTATTRTGS